MAQIVFLLGSHCGSKGGDGVQDAGLGYPNNAIPDYGEVVSRGFQLLISFPF